MRAQFLQRQVAAAVAQILREVAQDIHELEALAEATAQAAKFVQVQPE